MASFTYNYYYKLGSLCSLINLLISLPRTSLRELAIWYM